MYFMLGYLHTHYSYCIPVKICVLLMEEAMLEWYSHGLPKPTQAREVWEHAPSIKTL